MDRPDQLLEVGRIYKAHGLRGEVVVGLITDRNERVAPGAVLFTDDATLVVQASRSHQESFLVQFVSVTDRNGAEVLHGKTLYAEPIDDPDALWVHELIGKTVIDQDNVNRGEVVAVVANPASDLLELNSGALVPLTFVVGNDGDIIRVDVPNGLF